MAPVVVAPRRSLLMQPRAALSLHASVLHIRQDQDQSTPQEDDSGSPTETPSTDSGSPADNDEDNSGDQNDSPDSDADTDNGDDKEGDQEPAQPTSSEVVESTSREPSQPSTPIPASSSLPGNGNDSSEGQPSTPLPTSTTNNNGPQPITTGRSTSSDSSPSPSPSANSSGPQAVNNSASGSPQVIPDAPVATAVSSTAEEANSDVDVDSESIIFSDIVTTGPFTTLTTDTITSGSSTFTTTRPLITTGTITTQIPITTITAADLDNLSGGAARPKPVGAIVGGVLGGLAFIAILAFLFLIWRRRMRSFGDTKFTRILPVSSRSSSWAVPQAEEAALAPQMIQTSASTLPSNLPQFPPATFDSSFQSYDNGSKGGYSASSPEGMQAAHPSGPKIFQYQNHVQAENPFADQNPFIDPTPKTHGHARSTSSAYSNVPKHPSPLKQSTSA